MKKNILIVEDEEPLRSLYEEELKEEVYERSVGSISHGLYGVVLKGPMFIAETLFPHGHPGSTAKDERVQKGVAAKPICSMD